MAIEATTHAQSRWQRRDVLSVLLLALAGALLTLLAGQVMKVRGDRALLAAYTDKLMAHADDVAATTHRTLRQLQTMGAAPCSDEDLTQLRLASFDSHVLRDAGRMEGEAIACTAIWGRLDPPRPIPRPSVVHGPIRLWTAIHNPAEPRLAADFAAIGDAFVVTSPTAFDNFSHIDPALGALIVTRDGRHRFQSFGETAGMAPDDVEAAYDIESVRHARACSQDFDICVATRLRHSSILAKSVSASLGLCLLGGLVGGSAGIAWILYRRNRGSLPMQLQHALTEDGLTLHYQPLRRLHDRRLVGAEALARWRTAGGDWIPPDVFAPLAVRMQLGGQLTRQVLRKALREMRHRLRDDTPFHLSINVWASDLVDPSFHDCLDAECAAHGIDPRRIALELNERSTTDETELARHTQALRDKGYQIYIDDFGTGHSNLAYLTTLPIDVLKIDQRFIRFIDESPLGHPIVKPILDMARQLDIDVVTEGIETEAQARFVQQHAPRAVGQGWLLGKPATVANFPAE